LNGEKAKWLPNSETNQEAADQISGKFIAKLQSSQPVPFRQEQPQKLYRVIM